MSAFALCRDLASCRRCADAGYFIGSTPIFTLNAGAVFMTVGQAPGRQEAEVTHKPFSGPAGKRLFRWLAQAGFDEADFRASTGDDRDHQMLSRPASRRPRRPGAFPRRAGALRAVARAGACADRPEGADPHRRVGDQPIPGQRAGHDRADRRAVRARRAHRRAAAASLRGQPMVQRAGEQGAIGAGAGGAGRAA